MPDRRPAETAAATDTAFGCSAAGIRERGEAHTECVAVMGPGKAESDGAPLFRTKSVIRNSFFMASLVRIYLNDDFKNLTF